ncbi:hypothetical protein [Acidithiobacillus sp.]|uniref:hypothetical protein n=1 Tax=Acidithiobacillus sp. TaxID=1872118 RepID=UPI00258C5260|nr:hypothetical protein [Acidithiobacillus sp.]MDD5375759.1 hypothetical protein [Acidithiobacillus sp.]MDD5547109.1 hypothetical protein [Candidatus Omnitrophota bacterium]
MQNRDASDYPPPIYSQVKMLYLENQENEKKIRKLEERCEELEREKNALKEALRMLRGEPK